MSSLQICRSCLQTDTKIYNYDLFQLKSYYEEVLGLKVDDFDGLPHYFCFECATMLHKFHKFKEKCYTAQKVFKEILWKGPVTYEKIYEVDRKKLKLKSPIKIYRTVVDHHDPNLSKEDTDSASVKEEIYEENNERIETIEENPLSDHDYETHEVSVESDDKDKSDLENKKEGKLTNCIKGNFKKANLLDVNHWKAFELSEEEALKAFRAKAEDDKYIQATFKCTDCYKWFSKEQIYRRHCKLVHAESRGHFECKFCKMKFKWNCEMRKHIAKHYWKYQCLRCNLVCPSEASAILHDEMHSGVVKICMYCNEEFRHTSTFYTHLRTHRSEYVCALCGSSFVSELGLRQHKLVKHCTNDIESPDDDEDVNTFCEQCNIRFETRKAYDEHLFHSALHNEGIEDEDKREIKPRKILSKRMQVQISKAMRESRKTNGEDELKDTKLTTARKKFWRRIRRNRTKPTTCHQCGKHFATQSACLKHHLSEHPRTSFFPPAERHICEVCGASLAPGSIKMHQNMHTREITYPCETCGKSFHTNIGLKRHLVCHTGEKPYKCDLCDKRFTQSNSMKLHYRTFHLKQPYPKRNRRKLKNDISNETKINMEVQSDTDAESESKKRVRSPKAVIEQVQVPESQIMTNIEYLTF